jgi:hypothetical protein
MQTAKKLYSNSAQAIAALPVCEDFSRRSQQAEPYGWRRWAASLLAIHQPRRMIALDLPWWHVEATRQVENFLAARPEPRVFEYGSGASTAWLARRAKTVISVEHHAGWHKALSGMIADLANVQLWHRPIDGEGYVNAIAEAGGQFDLVVVDGRRRIDCLQRAKAFLKPGGIILFDDSGRLRYRKGIKGCGLTEQHFFGRSYCVPYPDHSSILHA